MNANIHQRVMGEFRTELVGRDGKVRWDSGFNKNMVVNAGLAYLTSQAQASALQDVRTMEVGTGNTAPAEADTALVALNDSIVLGTGSATWVAQFEIVGAEAIGRAESIYLFDFTDAIGNLRELGVRFGATGTMWARDLFRDTEGAPITIEKTIDDQLRITYRVTIVVDLVEVTTNPDLTIDGTPTTTEVVLKPQAVAAGAIFKQAIRTADEDSLSGPRIFTKGGVTLYPDNTPRSGVYTQTGPASIANALSLMTPTNVQVLNISNGVTGGVYWIQRTHRVPSSQGNVVGGLVGSISFWGGNQVAGTGGQFIIHLDPKVPKDITRRMDFIVRHHWARV